MRRFSVVARPAIIVLLLVIMAVCVSGCARHGKDDGSTPVPGDNAEPVPPAYQQLYRQLEADMEDYNISLNAQSAMRSRPIYGAELLPANANRGEELLKPDAIKGAILYMDRLQGMGVQGITLSIGYPLYMPDNPRHSEYAAFYKQVVDEARKRGMIVEVETGVLFSGTAFSAVNVSYDRMSYDEYRKQRKQMTVALLNDLRPDYLGLGAEPDTEYGLTGQEELLSPEQYTEYVNFVLEGLDRGATKIGAGVGSWGNLAYVENYVTKTSLDYIQVHVYPVDGQRLEKIDAIARLAHDHNKSVVMDECWLYKTDKAAASVAANDGIFKRDAYSFWAPLDQQFLALMDRSARVNGIEYVSPFWANFFFAYVDYDPSMERMSYAGVVAQANSAAAKNIVAGRYSGTGEYYRQLINEGR